MADVRARSTFVSVTGTLAVVVSLVGVLISIVQLIVARNFASAGTDVRAPSLVIEVLPAVFAGSAAVSIAFLKRRQWARIGMLFLAVAGFTLHFRWLVYGWRNTGDLPADGSDSFQATLKVIRVLSSVYPIVACALFAFVAIRLMSRAVRREFDSPHSAAG